MSSIYTSAEPLIALLHDDDVEIRAEALQLLNNHVHEFWSQLVPVVGLIESLSGVDEIGHIAALVAAKIYYHIDKQDEALRCVVQSKYLITQLDEQSSSPSTALPADHHAIQFDEQFQQAMIARAIEIYVSYQRQNYFYQEYLTNLNASEEQGDDDFSLSKFNPQSVPTKPADIDQSIAVLLNLLINRSLLLGEFTCALGLAIDTLRLDWLRHILVTVSAKDAAALMKETFKIAIEIVDIHPFRQELLRTLTDLYLTAPTPSAQAAGSLTPVFDNAESITAQLGTESDDSLRPSKDTELFIVSDILALCQCLLALNDAERTADILTQLISSKNQFDHLLAYQVAYDLTQNQHIAFTADVASQIIASNPTKTTTGSTLTQQTATVTPVVAQAAAAAKPRVGGTGRVGGFGELGGLPQRSALSASSASSSSNLPTVEPSNLEDEKNLINEASAELVNGTESDDNLMTQAMLDEAQDNLKNILNGFSSAMLHTHFYHRNNNTNDEWFAKLTSFHDINNDQTAASQLYAGYAIAQAGTNRDGCVRNSWSTFDKLSEWAAFTARASLGNIYRGQFDTIKDILKPFLPNPAMMSTREGSEVEMGNYTHGGSLYAMGLAACGVTNSHVPFLSTVLEKSIVNKDEPVQSGAALALGLCSIGSGNAELFDLLRPIVWGNQPIAGLTAGIAMGLIYTGLSQQPEVQDIIAEILPTARSNQHPNIQLGQGLGLALMYFNAQQGSESLIAELRAGPLSSQYTRWLSCWVDAMAYCGTGNIKVVERLLSLAITDPDNDVKRTAVMSLAFVLLNEPNQCIRILEPLANSYNEHIRYAVAMAIGLVCSSSGLSQEEYSSTIVHALAILQPLLKDSNSSVVRQGALIGYCMALQQTTSPTRYNEALEMIEECFPPKRTSASSQIPTIYRVSAALGAGILHSSGMNSNIRLIAPVGNQRRTIAIAGMMLFCNYWNWYPLANMFSLALSPTAIIGTYFAPAGASTSSATTLSGVVKPSTSVRVAPKLRFVVKVQKESMRYPKKEVDETKAAAKKVVINTLSVRSKRSGKDTTTPTTGNNNSTSSLGRTPSLRTFGSDLTRSFSKSDKTPTPTTKKQDDKKMDDAAAPITPTSTTAQLNRTSSSASTSSLDKPVLGMSLSQVEKKRRTKDDKVHVTVVQNCTRILPRHIAKVTCPKGQQYEPIKNRLFGIVVLKSNITPEQRKAALEAEKAERLLAANAAAGSTASTEDDKNKDELTNPAAITPGGDISRAEPTVPGPFTMKDE